MATVLFTWELGAGMGHVMRMLPLAKGLAARIRASRSHSTDRQVIMDPLEPRQLLSITDVSITFPSPASHPQR